MKLWERWLFKTSLKSMLITLGLAALVFSVIDLSAHPWVFSANSFLQIALFSLMQLSKMLPLLIGFSAFMGTILCLVHLRASNVTKALFTNGLSSKQIARPLILASLLLASLSLLNYEALYPIASGKVSSMKRLLTHKSPLKKPSIYRIDYPSKQRLICSDIDQKKGTIEDAYLIEGKFLYHAKRLQKPFSTNSSTKDRPSLEGSFVDTFSLSEKGLQKVKSEQKHVFNTLFWPKPEWIEAPNPEHMPFSQLIQSSLKAKAPHSHKLALNMRLLSLLLAPLGAAFAFLFMPSFSRRFSTLTLYSAALIGQVFVLMMLGQAPLFFGSEKAPSLYFIWLIPLAFVPFMGISRRFAK